MPCNHKIQPVVLDYSVLNGSATGHSTSSPYTTPHYAAIIAAEAIGSTGSGQVFEIDVNQDTR